MKGLISLTSLAFVFGCNTAQAQYTDGTIKIGVMNDMSGLYSDISGRGSVVAARMAVEDFGAAAKGMKVEILGPTIRTSPMSARILCGAGSILTRSMSLSTCQRHRSLSR